MDYKGQMLCEYMYSIIVILFGAIAWVVGYIQGDFYVTFQGWALCIPDWPFFNRNKVTWLEEVGRSNTTKDKDSQKGKKKSVKTN
eukprot:gene28658-34601_t